MIDASVKEPSPLEPLEALLQAVAWLKHPTDEIALENLPPKGAQVWLEWALGERKLEKHLPPSIKAQLNAWLNYPADSTERRVATMLLKVDQPRPTRKIPSFLMPWKVFYL
jgi:hypothetical protein